MFSIKDPLTALVSKFHVPKCYSCVLTYDLLISK